MISIGKGSKKRPRQVSREEEELRWEYGKGELNITEEELKIKIKEIRQRTRKP